MTGKIIRWVVWAMLWIAGVFLTGVSAMHLLADSHRWDARVSLPVQNGAAHASATFRSLSGGAVNVFATSLVHGSTAPIPFRGAIKIKIVGADGSLIREDALGRGGVPHEQASGSSWTLLGQVKAPRIWFAPWRLEARVLAADPAFPAERIDIILRKERPDLGMGGMVFYVTIFIGVFFVLMASLLAGVWRSVLGNAPLVLSAAAVLLGLILVVA